jgi:multiple sugar transport system substrate-binding protein
MRSAAILTRTCLCCLALAMLGACSEQAPQMPHLSWYVFDERSGAFEQAAQSCSEAARGRYRIDMIPLPSGADQQREQLVRRLAAGDAAIDLIGMDVIWTAEFAAAGWILPWPEALAREVRRGRLGSSLKSASYRQQLWALPFTTNTQLLWYRSDRVVSPPRTWDELFALADELGPLGIIEAQGERYEGLTVFFVSLLASAGGSVLTADGRDVSLEAGPTRRALQLMKRLATSSAADPALATSRENEARLAFETGRPSFMLNYTFVWPSAHSNAPEVAGHMAWARWPAVDADRPSRVTLGGINLGVGAYSPHPELAFEAATCIAGEANQRLAASMGGMPPTLAALYDDPQVRGTFPFAKQLRETLQDAVQRPQTPLYADLSLAISHSLHPMREIDPERDVERLREAVGRALRSEGLL